MHLLVWGFTASSSLFPYICQYGSRMTSLKIEKNRLRNVKLPPWKKWVVLKFNIKEMCSPNHHGSTQLPIPTYILRLSLLQCFPSFLGMPYINIPKLLMFPMKLLNFLKFCLFFLNKKLTFFLQTFLPVKKLPPLTHSQIPPLISHYLIVGHTPSIYNHWSNLTLFQ